MELQQLDNVLPETVSTPWVFMVNVPMGATSRQTMRQTHHQACVVADGPVGVAAMSPGQVWPCCYHWNWPDHSTAKAGWELTYTYAATKQMVSQVCC